MLKELLKVEKKAVSLVSLKVAMMVFLRVLMTAALMVKRMVG